MRYSELYSDRKLEIENALLRLMQQKPLAEITVKEIADHLGFVRKTFYHYYPNKMACLEALTDRMINECDLHQMQTLPGNPTLAEQYAAHLKFWIANKVFLDVIIRNNLGAFFAERIILYLRQEHPELLSRIHTAGGGLDEDMLFFYTIGEVSLLLRWCAQGFPLSVEEMTAKKLRLLYEPPFSDK